MLENIIKASAIIEAEKERILDYICQDYHNYKDAEKNKMGSGKLFICNFSDIKDSWLPEDVYSNYMHRINGTKKTNQKFGEIESIIDGVKNSKNVVLTLSKMLQFKNCTNVKGYYFKQLDEVTLDRIAEVLGDNFIPTYTIRNIGNNLRVLNIEELSDKRKKEIEDVYKRIEKVKINIG